MSNYIAAIKALGAIAILLFSGYVGWSIRDHDFTVYKLTIEKQAADVKAENKTENFVVLTQQLKDLQKKERGYVKKLQDIKFANDNLNFVIDSLQHGKDNRDGSAPSSTEPCIPTDRARKAISEFSREAAHIAGEADRLFGIIKESQ